MMAMNSACVKQGATAGCLIAVGVLGRLSLRDLLPRLPDMTITVNGITQPVFIADLFFVVAVVSLLAGILLRGYLALSVPVGVMVITDLLYGNGYIFLFTWSGFAFLALLALSARAQTTTLSAGATARFVGIGIGGVLLYDAWTNVGWWLGPYYPHTLDGLVLCFTVALPFTVWHLLSTGLILAGVAPLALYLKNHTLRFDTLEKNLERYSPVAASLALAGASFLSAL
jgi:hypothetical protein